MNTFQKIVNKRKEDVEMFETEYQKAFETEVRNNAITTAKKSLGRDLDALTDDLKESVIQYYIQYFQHLKEHYNDLKKAKIEADYNYYDLLIAQQEATFESRLYRLVMLLSIDDSNFRMSKIDNIIDPLVKSVNQKNAFEFLNYFYNLLRESYEHYLFNYYWRFVKHCVFNFTFEKKDLYKVLDQSSELLNMSEYLGKETYFLHLRKIASINNKTPKTSLKPNQSLIDGITKYGFFL